MSRRCVLKTVWISENFNGGFLLCSEIAATTWMKQKDPDLPSRPIQKISKGDANLTLTHNLTSAERRTTFLIVISVRQHGGVSLQSRNCWYLSVCVFQVATQNISKLGAANVHLIYQFMASRKCWSMSRWFANPLFSKPRCKGVGETWRLQANSPGIGLDLEQNLTPGAPFLASKMTGCPKVWVAWLRPLYNREINKVCAWERLEIYMEI